MTFALFCRFYLDHPFILSLFIINGIGPLLYFVKLGLFFAKTEVTWKRSWGIMACIVLFNIILTLLFVIGFALNQQELMRESITSIILLLLLFIIQYFMVPVFSLRIFKIKLSISKYFLFFLGAFIIPVIITFLLSISIRYFVSPFQINGSAMYPNYPDQKLIMAAKYNQKYERGDVIVMRPYVDITREFYIKRIIGLPNEIIRFESGSVYIKKQGNQSFEKLEELYLDTTNKDKTTLPLDVKENEFLIPEGEYWVMGDNRQNSADSRQCFKQCIGVNSNSHFAKYEYIVGKVMK